MQPVLTCTPKELPGHLHVAAAHQAVLENPVNAPRLRGLARRLPGLELTPAFIAVLTTKYWGAGGVKLSVQFLDTQDRALQAKILAHMNAWGKWANVHFTLTRGHGDVRIARTPGQGYWSYLGTDIKLVPATSQTMNLDSFALATPDSEYARVVRHETGHTLGCPHEHMRLDLVRRLNRQAVINYFMATQGWSRQEVIDQVLTPLNERSLMATPADQTSIMCYQIPGELTLDGRPVTGGEDINATDGKFMGSIYPKH